MVGPELRFRPPFERFDWFDCSAPCPSTSPVPYEDFAHPLGLCRRLFVLSVQSCLRVAPPVHGAANDTPCPSGVAQSGIEGRYSLRVVDRRCWDRGDRDRHVGAVRAVHVIGEWSARAEAGPRVKPAGGSERRGGSRLQTDSHDPAAPGFVQEVFDHRPPDPSPPSSLSGVHRLDLGVFVVELFKSTDPEELSVETEAEKANGWVRQSG